MKITHLLYGGLGGHSNVFFSLVREDKKAVFNYSAIFYGIESPSEDLLRTLTGMSIAHRFVKKREGLDLIYWVQIFRALQREHPDIVFLHSSYNIIPCVLYRIFNKSVIIVRETQANHLKSRIERLMLGVALLFSNKVVFLSKFYRDQIKGSYGILFSQKRNVIIPNGLDLNFFKPNSTNMETYSIGMLSRIVPIKDHKTLIEAFSKLKIENIKLKIAGDGESLNSLKELARKLKLEENVIFHGRVREEDIPDFLNALNIYVHATYGETMSTSIMQAQACGLPIIASDVDGVNNVIKHGINGLLVPVGDVQILAEAIEELVNNEQLRDNLSTASLAYSKENLSSQTMFGRYKKVILQAYDH